MKFRTLYAFTYKEVDKLKKWDYVTIQVMKKWSWDHELYGSFEVDQKVFDDVINNFVNNVRGVDIAVDMNHEPDTKAMWWYREVYQEWDALFAKIELTQYWVDNLKDGQFKYFSPEIIWEGKDEESGKEYSNLLIGGAFTNRPFFKNMDSLKASESTRWEEDQENNLYFTKITSMNKFKELLAKFSELETLTQLQKMQLASKFFELNEAEQEEVKDQVEELVEKTAEPKDPQTNPNDGEWEGEDSDADPSGGKDEKKPKTGEFSEAHMKKFHEMEQRVIAMEIEKAERDAKDTFAKYTFSETNKKGVLKPAMQSKFCELLVSLNDKQKKLFTDILENVQASPLETLGTSKTAEFSESDSEKVAKAVTKIQQEKGVSYSEAYSLYRAQQ